MKSCNNILTGLLVCCLCVLPVVVVSQNCTHVIYPSPDSPTVLTPSSFYNLKPGDTICFMAGDYFKLYFQNIHGDESSPIIIINKDGRAIVNNDSFFGIAFHNCSHIKMLGNGSADYDYGLAVLAVGHGNGISVDQKSTNIEIGHIEVGNVGQSGIMVKTDPRCNDLSSVRDSFALFETIIHNSYIHHTGNEGLYLGSSYYGGLPLQCNGTDTVVLPHEMIGVKVYNNILKRTGRNSIQVSSAPEGCYIYNNLVLEDSQKGESFHMNGIQVGGGSRCNVFNNTVTDGKGSGIHYFGRGPGMIYNNLIVNPGRSHYPELPPNQFPVHGIYVMHTFTDTDDPIHIFHNTIYNPKTEGIRFANYLTEGNRIQNNIIINPGAFPYIGHQAFVASCLLTHDLTVSHNFLDIHAGNVLFKDTLEKDFSLSGSSPAIDAGIDLEEYGITSDITGAPRPIGIAPDQGAFECQEPSLNNTETETIEFNIYPNPTGDFINVKLSNVHDEQLIRLFGYDIGGNRVFEYVFNGGTKYITIPVYNLRAGKYIIAVLAGNKRGTGAFVRKVAP